MTMQIPPSGTHGTRMPRGAAARIGSRFMAAVYRMSGGRSAPDGLLITTVGARSGQRRTASIRRFDDGPGRWLVVGSAGGSARNPGWLYNLAAHPEQVWVEIGKDRFKVRPEILADDERTTAWTRVVAEAPNFGSYEVKTDRQIPVVRLTAEP
jgi:deazaflavin-dependent oxidoreductase (nitroreductase family)